ncbi:MAG: flavin reductase family protein [Candidatus Aquicultor sp.]
MPQEFTGRKAMGAIGSPVVLVTANHNGRRGIMTINMLAGIAFAPPQVCISLSHHSHTRSLIEQSQEFAINSISEEQAELAKQIGGTTGNKIDKYREFDIEVIEGTIIKCLLVKAAHTVLECKVMSSVDLGNHTLYIGEVVAYHELGKGYPLYLYHGHYYTIGEQVDTL